MDVVQRDGSRAGVKFVFPGGLSGGDGEAIAAVDASGDFQGSGLRDGSRGPSFVKSTTEGNQTG